MSTPDTAPREAMVFWRYITSSVEQLLATLDEVTPDEINLAPAANASSLYVLAAHTLGTTAENLLEVLCGQPVHRQRELEFTAAGESPAALREQWHALRSEIQTQLEQVNDAALDAMRVHPRRGQISGREVLIVVARHCAEHMGQAFLTRDLLLAQRDSGIHDAGAKS